MIKPNFPFKQSLHTHTIFSDGKDTAEEMVVAAIKAGFSSLGFSDHAYAPYDSDCCMKKENLAVYLAEIASLKKKYVEEIEIFCGLECDRYHPSEKTNLDYAIGSVHYVFCEASGEYFPIDFKPEILEDAIQKVSNGDIKDFIRKYYNNVVNFAETYRPNIIGHFDLIRRLNSDNRFFDPESAWYQQIVDSAIEKIAGTSCIVEVNTGGMRRGGLIEPYPSSNILSKMCDAKIPVTISSDAHDAQILDFWFDEAGDLLRKIGFKRIKHLTANGFVDVEL